MKLLISAAEASSDTHAAALVRALRHELSEIAPDEKLEIMGIGGPELMSEGLKPWVDAKELLSMGFSEIVSKLPRILRALSHVVMQSKIEQPDVAVFMDYPDFHFRLATRLKSLGIPLVYYIPPKIWAWRKSRIHTIRKLFSKVLCIFPFEESLYREASVPCKYVGNPLLDELPMNLTRQQARESLGLGELEKVLLLMPGSRPSEVKEHLKLLLDSAAQIANHLKQDLTVLMPFPRTTSLHLIRSQVESICNGNALYKRLTIKIDQGNSSVCMVASDVGLIKSGTSTLEAALLGCPHVLLYRGSLVSEWIFKNLVRYKGPVGLVNIIAQKSLNEVNYVTPEFLAEDASVENLTNAGIRLFSDEKARAQLLSSFDRIKTVLQGDAVRTRSPSHSPSNSAAREILTVWRNLRAREINV